MKASVMRKVVDKIEAAVQQPRQFFDMGDWAEQVWRVKPGQAGKSFWDQETELCGTAACFAGYAVPKKHREAFANNPEGCSIDIQQAAARKFNISSDQADLLFLTNAWPTKFFDAYHKAAAAASDATPGTKKAIKAELRKVKALRARVEHFIKTDGAE
jgi:hypothetical protein